MRHGFAGGLPLSRHFRRGRFRQSRDFSFVFRFLLQQGGSVEPSMHSAVVSQFGHLCFQITQGPRCSPLSSFEVFGGRGGVVRHCFGSLLSRRLDFGRKTIVARHRSA
jgi:hypothetical protein